MPNAIDREVKDLVEWWHPRADGPALRVRETTTHYPGVQGITPDDCEGPLDDVVVHLDVEAAASDERESFLVDAELAATLLPHLLAVLAREAPWPCDSRFHALHLLAAHECRDTLERLRPDEGDGGYEPF